MYMNKAIINFNTDPKLKREAKKVLKEMGLTLSIAMNASLKRIISERKVEFTAPEMPNARLRKAIMDAKKEYATGKMVIYKTDEALERHLRSL